MNHPHAPLTVDAWLEWFVTERLAGCRAYLCARYALNAQDAEELINAALLQVLRHWGNLAHPLAYVWQILKHAIARQEQRHSRERRQLAAYAQQQRLHVHSAIRTAEKVAVVLALVSPRQRRLLLWYAQGFTDEQVATWLTTTPQAVRVARHGAYQVIRAQCRPASGHAPVAREKNDF